MALSRTFSIDEWMGELVDKAVNEFGQRIAFIGLQGSYRRNEATDSSDIDVVVILDHLTMADLTKYRAIISQMPHKEKACGFISGKGELVGWEKSELFQFYHDTQPIHGKLDFLLPLITPQDIRRAVKIGAGNLYHACCHNYLYDNSRDILSALYKSSFFILQAKHFIETGRYIGSKGELLTRLNGIDKEMLTMCMERGRLVTAEEREFAAYHDNILSWSGSLLRSF